MVGDDCILTKSSYCLAAEEKPRSGKYERKSYSFHYLSLAEEKCQDRFRHLESVEK